MSILVVKAIIVDLDQRKLITPNRSTITQVE